ncbi:MAG: hypothetical protein AUG00_02655 [Candidatus Rokubacteria bacterium 13_1_20CM_2_70_7]|nr:MAG: hypothetical protein AUG00_02655 [Candidatus Rokubacteria bacterium 13_1_20CM_2_70_7]
MLLSFTDDVDYVNRGGGWWTSKKANVEGHEAIHDMLARQKQKMTYRSTVAKMPFLTPHIALVHATWEWPGFTMPSGEPTEDFRSRTPSPLPPRRRRRRGGEPEWRPF